MFILPCFTTISVDSVNDMMNSGHTTSHMFGLLVSYRIFTLLLLILPMIGSTAVAGPVTSSSNRSKLSIKVDRSSPYAVPATDGYAGIPWQVVRKSKFVVQDDTT